MGYINTYDIATLGHNSKNTYRIAIQGFNVYIQIDTIEPPLPPISGGGYLSGGLSHVIRRKGRDKAPELRNVQRTKEDRTETKKIKVCAIINGVQYCKSEIIKTKPNITIDDVDVTISNVNTKPKITIKVQKK